MLKIALAMIHDSIFCAGCSDQSGASETEKETGSDPMTVLSHIYNITLKFSNLNTTANTDRNHLFPALFPIATWQQST